MIMLMTDIFQQSSVKKDWIVGWNLSVIVKRTIDSVVFFSLILLKANASPVTFLASNSACHPARVTSPCLGELESTLFR